MRSDLLVTLDRRHAAALVDLRHVQRARRHRLVEGAVAELRLRRPSEAEDLECGVALGSKDLHVQQQLVQRSIHGIISWFVEICERLGLHRGRPGITEGLEAQSSFPSAHWGFPTRYLLHVQDGQDVVAAATRDPVLAHQRLGRV